MADQEARRKKRRTKALGARAVRMEKLDTSLVFLPPPDPALLRKPNSWYPVK